MNWTITFEHHRHVAITKITFAGAATTPESETGTTESPTNIRHSPFNDAVAPGPVGGGMLTERAHEATS